MEQVFECPLYTHWLVSWPDATHNCSQIKKKSYISHFGAMVSPTHLWKYHMNNRHALPKSFLFSVKQPMRQLIGSSNIERFEPVGTMALVKVTVSIGLRLQASGVSLWPSAIRILPAL